MFDYSNMLQHSYFYWMGRLTPNVWPDPNMMFYKFLNPHMVSNDYVIPEFVILTMAVMDLGFNYRIVKGCQYLFIYISPTA